MRVPERMIIEGHVQLVMNHSGTVLKGVRADEFPVLSDAQEIHALRVQLIPRSTGTIRYMVFPFLFLQASDNDRYNIHHRAAGSSSGSAAACFNAL